ncbi:hypothetical protein U14_03811 [Candidatus Moduliflexus flocculans]|uniref:SPOR domain-containing protein n=1 Tax=Candidatus Moduliflexus flocculans TaxID=1499966 RepID=A0A081BQ93_9BACT|nr:hypothetical protein U14_03811 [Candidatus Moduliflexus flocculans]
MKNFHKVRGKREFLFDDKELYVLGGGAAVICVLIFVLGFMLGQSLQEPSVASPVSTAQTLPGEMTDDSEETANTPVSDAQSLPQSSRDNQGIETATNSNSGGRSYYKVLPDKETYVQVEATPAREENPSPQPQIQAPQEPVEDVAVADQVQQAQVKEETPIPPSAQQPIAKTPAVSPGVAPALPNVPKNPTDEIHVGRQQTQPVGLNEPTLPPGSTIYSVQVASSPSREDAERLVQKFSATGFQAYVMVADLGSKGVWYRVRIGNFVKRDQAETFKEELMRNASQMIKSPYVIKVTE